ncbi:polysaccharide biosynthesis/export family protein [Hyphomicrobium sp.]|jgi:polysaccharide export outer membrane protein|uniref:polysaccharide biosynthesis/export family protein n=1 Tax=Hyphomicrobium sp. TaxID=82 RepID=UPI002CEB6449|nr:polysaccharide biosynthesis/export family protein [Hyphomicrobium sp.]HVZ04311.1 polysaccharide biosynthesis/export family protein [Hyphomicrobium sp.]
MHAIRYENSARGVSAGRSDSPKRFSQGAASSDNIISKGPRAHGLIASIALLIGMGLPIGPAAVADSPVHESQSTATTDSLGAAPLSDADQQDADSNGVDQTYSLEIGDRIKVSVYGRVDLSGQYSVNEMGKIRVPTLGAFDAAGQSPMTLESQIGVAVENTTHRKADVTVDVIERRPVFVTGLVAKPGSYPYIRDMTVIQAMALAGGTSLAGGSSYLPTEALREMARLRASDIEYRRLVARQARLIADQTGHNQIDMPQLLVEVAGPLEATRLIADEQRYYDNQRESRKNQISSLEDSIKQAKLEVDSYVREQESIGKQLTTRKTMLEAIRRLAKSGLTTQQRLTDSEILVAMVERDQRETAANIARSRQNVARLQRELAVLTLDRRQEIDKQLQAVDDQLASLETTIQGSSKIIHQVGLTDDTMSRDGSPHYRYEILRKSVGGSGLVSISGDESTRLLPGDVVRVSVGQSKKKSNNLDVDNNVVNSPNHITTISSRLGSFNLRD